MGINQTRSVKSLVELMSRTGFVVLDILSQSTSPIIVSSSNVYLPETKPLENASKNPYNGGMYQKIYQKENEKKHGGLNQTKISNIPKIITSKRMTLWWLNQPI